MFIKSHFILINDIAWILSYFSEVKKNHLN